MGSTKGLLVDIYIYSLSILKKPAASLKGLPFWNLLNKEGRPMDRRARERNKITVFNGWFSYLSALALLNTLDNRKQLAYTKGEKNSQHRYISFYDSLSYLHFTYTYVLFIHLLLKFIVSNLCIRCGSTITIGVSL